MTAANNCPSLKYVVAMDTISEDEKALAAKNNITLVHIDEVEKHVSQRNFSELSLTKKIS